MSASAVENRLIREKSPYLLQHAHNPVNWYTWGVEAFAKAGAEDRPVFLSIGYSTCHWCHVMAHESFEDTQVASALNAGFVCIKVDREERPDIDAVYMAVCQALTGSGGWPLTILMTPKQKPFWAGTYLPKTARYGSMGLLELLAAVLEQWKTDREKLLIAGEEITSFLRQSQRKVSSDVEPDRLMLRAAFQWFEQSYDVKWGGFGEAPKFPAPHNLLFLLRFSALEKNNSARRMAEYTLEQMARGGIFDHIGGGFSRYSTDERWLVPHFEKMLYDNALLAMAYLEMFRQTRRPVFRRVAERTLRYVLRELTNADGAFYCGQDADSDGVEGKYYVITLQEITQVLGKSDATAFCDWFGITEKGNFEGKSIPNLLDNPHWEETVPQMDALCKKLYGYRFSRTRLHKDDKVLTSWNALMIVALAQAGWILHAPKYLQDARAAQHFLNEHLIDARGRLLLRWRDGEAAIDGQLNDYAFSAFALLILYQTTFEVTYLQQACRTAAQMLDLFFDADGGGLCLYSKDAEQLIQRPKEAYDGAMPSGNAIAALVLARLFQLTGDTSWQATCAKQMSWLAEQAQSYPAGHCAALLAFAEVLYPMRELVCVVAEEALPADLQIFLQEDTHELTVIIKTKENQHVLAEAAPFTKDYPIPKSGVVYYLCENGACSSPTSSLQKLRQLLKRKL